jgi:hypothetical protein
MSMRLWEVHIGGDSKCVINLSRLSYLINFSLIKLAYVKNLAILI